MSLTRRNFMTLSGIAAGSSVWSNFAFAQVGRGIRSSNAVLPTLPEAYEYTLGNVWPHLSDRILTAISSSNTVQVANVFWTTLLVVWADNTPSRVSTTDWYNNVSGKQMGFQTHSVVGRIFIKTLFDSQIASRWQLPAVKGN